ncbi:MAG: hypothetical protein PHU51_05660 [Candidatus Nanoarchaeia archaeon]|nr:hypothetical protein [Candidatus Nanoarchaeia archaeon]
MDLEARINKDFFTQEERELFVENCHIISNVSKTVPKLYDVIYPKLKQKIDVNTENFYDCKTFLKVVRTLEGMGVEFDSNEYITSVGCGLQLINLCENSEVIEKYGLVEILRQKSHLKQHVLSLYDSLIDSLGIEFGKDFSEIEKIKTWKKELFYDVLDENLNKLYVGDSHDAYILSKMIDSIYNYPKNECIQTNEEVMEIIKDELEFNEQTKVKQTRDYVKRNLQNIIGTTHMNKYFRYGLNTERKESLKEAVKYKTRFVEYIGAKISWSKGKQIHRKKLLVDALMDLCVCEYDFNRFREANPKQYFSRIRTMEEHYKCLLKHRTNLTEKTPWKEKRLNEIKKLIDRINYKKDILHESKGSYDSRRSDVQLVYKNGVKQRKFC